VVVSNNPPRKTWKRGLRVCHNADFCNG
jgi:hypothetical protein